MLPNYFAHNRVNPCTALSPEHLTIVQPVAHIAWLSHLTKKFKTSTSSLTVGAVQDIKLYVQHIYKEREEKEREIYNGSCSWKTPYNCNNIDSCCVVASCHRAAATCATCWLLAYWLALAHCGRSVGWLFMWWLIKKWIKKEKREWNSSNGVGCARLGDTLCGREMSAKNELYIDYGLVVLD